MFAALAMVAKDKLGFWSSRAKGASEACFLFCYFFAPRMRCCAVQTVPLPKVKMAEEGIR